MDFPWPPGNLPPSHDGGLNLLDGSNLLLDLDDRTLQCLVGGPPLPPAPNDGEAGPSNSRRHEEDFSNWLADGFANSGGAMREGADDDSTGEDATAAAAGSRRSGRKKAASDAAAVKATREKARRERMNEYFDELSRLCDPSGKGAKVDRVSVVADAIRVVSQLRVENNQLRQLNKFLEERVGVYERARAQAMFQQAVAVAHQPAAYAQQKPQPQQVQPQQHIEQQQQDEELQQAMLAAASAHGAAPGAPRAAIEIQPAPFSVAMAPQGLQVAVGAGGVQYALVPLHAAPGSLGAQVMALKEEHLGAAAVAGGMPQPATLAAPSQSALPPGAPAVGWLPAPDLSQDQKLRPPAA